MKKSYEKVSGKLKKMGLSVERDDQSIIISGEVDTYAEKIEYGFFAASQKTLQVVNNIKVRGLEEAKEPNPPKFSDNKYDGKSYDVVVIGGGVTGTSILRELTKYNLKCALVDKESDVCMHASARNDGMIHPGFAAKPGSLKAYYNVRGNALYQKLCDELEIPVVWPGSILMYSNPFFALTTPILKKRAKKNGVPGTCFLSRKRVQEMSPATVVKQYGAFFMPTAGQLSPMRLVSALAENAVENGADVLLNTQVLDFESSDGRIDKVVTNRGKISCSCVVNAAGSWADFIAEKAGDGFFTLHHRKGVDLILDKKCQKDIKHMQGMPNLLAPSANHSKGGGLVLTVEGNVLVGPNAKEVPYREKYDTEKEDIDELMKHINLNKNLGRQDIITYFAGIRACTYGEDFIIQKSKKVENLVHSAGIQSPGLASAPAISIDVAKMAVEVVSKYKDVSKNENFNPHRENAVPDLNVLSEEEREAFIKDNPSFGRIICRCEEVSEGEIRAVLRSKFPPTTLDGVKHRLRTMTGRCHGGFCTQRVIDIMIEELGLTYDEIVKNGSDSKLFFSKTKGDVEYSNRSKK